MPSPITRVSVQAEDFDVAALQRELAWGHELGAVTSFTGYVRDVNEQSTVESMELEHYPGMTERSIEKIIEQACERWPLLSVIVVHRIGTLRLGDQIVYVGVGSAHRGAAFEAAECVMDYLKTQAPFWKKERVGDAARWVEARSSDDKSAQRWED